jgi:hypothetical protein
LGGLKLNNEFAGNHILPLRNTCHQKATHKKKSTNCFHPENRSTKLRQFLQIYVPEIDEFWRQSMEPSYKTGDLVMHERYGKGKILKTESIYYSIDFGKQGVIDISFRSEDQLKAFMPEAAGGFSDGDLVEKKLIEILQRYQGIQENVPLGDRWQGGKMVLQPANESLKAKEIPLEVFFHKIVMIRDRLRVLEQQINSHAKLSDEDKVNLQQYITRSYGSLTSFNVLFKEPEQQFTGEKGKD